MPLDPLPRPPQHVGVGFLLRRECLNIVRRNEILQLRRTRLHDLRLRPPPLLDSAARGDPLRSGLDAITVLLDNSIAHSDVLLWPLAGLGVCPIERPSRLTPVDRSAVRDPCSAVRYEVFPNYAGSCAAGSGIRYVSTRAQAITPTRLAHPTAYEVRSTTNPKRGGGNSVAVYRSHMLTPSAVPPRPRAPAAVARGRERP